MYFAARFSSGVPVARPFSAGSARKFICFCSRSEEIAGTVSVELLLRGTCAASAIAAASTSSTLRHLLL